MNDEIGRHLFSDGVILYPSTNEKCFLLLDELRSAYLRYK